MLIGCGCHAQRAGELLIDRGWQVRGTTRDEARRDAIGRAGIEAVEADPDRVGSLVELVADVTVLAWALGDATGSEEAVAALYRERLPSLLAAIVDTPIRGLVYEAAGSVDAGLLAEGRRAVEEAGARSRIPTACVDLRRGPGESAWAPAVADAVEGVAGVS